MGNSSSGNVGIVIVSHSSKIAEGAADMVRQMVGNAVPLAWTGGDTDGGLGTNVAGVLQAIEAAWSPAGVAILVDLGGQPVVTLSDPEARLGAGDVVSLRLNKPLFFDADGGRVAA